MKTRIKMLKVKIKSLAAEARIIRLEEHRAKGRRVARPAASPEKPAYVGRDDALRVALHHHRVDDLRAEQRCSLLAYAFLRGRSLARVERPYRCRTDNPDWSRVLKLADKFGPVLPAESREQTQQWLAELQLRLTEWTKATAPTA